MEKLSHLDALEAEAIYIIREVAAECEKPVMLYAIFIDIFKHFYAKLFSLLIPELNHFFEFPCCIYM